MLLAIRHESSQCVLDAVVSARQHNRVEWTVETVRRTSGTSTTETF